MSGPTLLSLLRAYRSAVSEMDDAIAEYAYATVDLSEGNDVRWHAAIAAHRECGARRDQAFAALVRACRAADVNSANCVPRHTPE